MLLVGAIVAYLSNPSPRLNAVIMAAGAGLLLGSVAYDLIEEALKSSSLLLVIVSFFLGSAVFVIGDLYLDRMGAAQRKDPNGAQGGISVPLLAGVALSNFPEGMASSSGLRAAGWPLTRVSMMWITVIVVSAISAAAGYILLDLSSIGFGSSGQGFAQAFAAGALLTMLCDTMLPEAYEDERVFTGALVVPGFAGSLLLAAF
jgi:ZIP family zinc transporter